MWRSAASIAPPTCTWEISGERGTARPLLATSRTGTCRRRLALKITSLIRRGQASASTQMFMALRTPPGSFTLLPRRHQRDTQGAEPAGRSS
jgi:hypothetical protein